jgi:hypothetical protein
MKVIQIKLSVKWSSLVITTLFRKHTNKPIQSSTALRTCLHRSIVSCSELRAPHSTCFLLGGSSSFSRGYSCLHRPAGSPNKVSPLIISSYINYSLISVKVYRLLSLSEAVFCLNWGQPPLVLGSPAKSLRLLPIKCL